MTAAIGSKQFLDVVQQVLDGPPEWHEDPQLAGAIDQENR
jgi:hypothetical protein